MLGSPRATPDAAGVDFGRNSQDLVAGAGALGVEADMRMSTMQKLEQEIRELKQFIVALLLIIAAFCAKYWGWL